MVPEGGVDYVYGESFAHEAAYDELNGVDFEKGCYVGQEVTARMKHKTELRKGLVVVTISALAGLAPTHTSPEASRTEPAATSRTNRFTPSPDRAARSPGRSAEG